MTDSSAPATFLHAVAWLLIASAISVQADKREITPAPHNLRQANVDRIAEVFQRDQEAYRGRDDVMVLPGLLANRAAGQVRVYAEAVGLDAKTEVEFLLIAPGSSHGYEALAVSFARGSDIRKALEFIGAPPGRPVSPRDQAFWPRGERVRITVESPARTRADKQSITLYPAQSLVTDRERGETLDNAHWLFTGSYLLGEDAGELEGQLAIDAFDPGSIVSVFNDGQTLFDVPGLVAKSEVYGKLFPNPDRMLAEGTIVAFIFEPTAPSGQSTQLDFELRLEPGSGAEAPPSLYLVGGETKPRGDLVGPEDLRQLLKTQRDQGRDVHLHFAPSRDVSIGHLRTFSPKLEALERDLEIRIEPPPPGGLYYKSFHPNPAFAHRDRRPSQPWELHIRREDGALRVQPIRILQQWSDDADQPTLKVESYGLVAPEALPGHLRTHYIPVPVLLLFCPPDLRYGELLDLIAPLKTDYPVVYVFPPMAED